MGEGETDLDLIRKVLTLEFKLFTEQLETFHVLNKTLQSLKSTALLPPLPSTLLPVLDFSSFETRLGSILNTSGGIKKDLSEKAVQLFRSLELKSNELSSVQREQISLAIAVLRNTDNLSEMSSFYSLGGGDLMCRWLQVFPLSLPSSSFLSIVIYFIIIL